VLAVGRGRQAIEKAAAFGRRTGEQRIHRRHHPDDAHVVGECRGRSHRLAINAVFSLRRRAVLGCALDAGAERRQPESAFDFGRNRP